MTINVPRNNSMAIGIMRKPPRAGSMGPMMPVIVKIVAGTTAITAFGTPCSGWLSHSSTVIPKLVYTTPASKVSLTFSWVSKKTPH